MYIRRVMTPDGYRYVLRETYRDTGLWRHRDLMDLGVDPGEFIEYPGGNGFYFKEVLEDKLQQESVEYSTEELERVFLPFLRPHVRRIVEQFQSPGRFGGRARWRGSSQDELLRRQKEIHSFDKRRLHYLRCGRIDIGELEGRPWKFLDVLLGKSRDEIEHTIEQMEGVLRPQEIKPYIFTAFHLQTHFPHHLLRNHPAALDGEKIDHFFLEEVCRLNSDRGFFMGADDHDEDAAHRYLVKYVILYFDHDFDSGRWEGHLHEFMRKRQFHGKPAPPGHGVSNEEACRILGISKEECKKMDRKDLIRLYREKAKEAHPDRGGDHESFVRMQRAYESLLEGK